MKIIYFIRHAKAKKIAATDFDRALSSKGKEAAKVMAARLKNKNICITVSVLIHHTVSLHMTSYPLLQ